MTELSGGGRPLRPGAPIRFQAEGSPDVPAFDEAMSAAEEVVLVKPPEGNLPSAPLEIAWEPNVSDTIAATLAGQHSSVTCIAEAKSGRLVIPQERVRQVTADPKRGEGLIHRSHVGLVDAYTVPDTFDVTARAMRARSGSTTGGAERARPSPRYPSCC